MEDRSERLITNILFRAANTLSAVVAVRQKARPAAAAIVAAFFTV